MTPLFKSPLVSRFIAIIFSSLGSGSDVKAQLGPTLPGPMQPWGVFTCLSPSGSICGQATGYDDTEARRACGNLPIATCFRSY